MTSKAKSQAILETLKSPDLTEDQRKTLQQSVKQKNLYTSGSKVLLFTSMILLVDWKKKVSFYKRQLPLAFVALFGAFGLDYFISEHYWKKNEKVVKRITGFNGEVYVSGEAMKNMRSMYKAKQNAKRESTKQELLYEDDADS